MSLNKVLLIGNVGKDPEVRHLESGAVTASFSLATTERYKDRNGEYKDQTEWHNIVCWRSTAEFAEKYVKKGSALYVEGKIRNRQYQDRDGNTRYIVEIYADDIRFVGRKSDSQPSENYSGGYNNTGNYNTGTQTGGYQSGNYQSGGYSNSYPSQGPINGAPTNAPQPKPQETTINIDSDDFGDDLPF